MGGGGRERLEEGDEDGGLISFGALETAVGEEIGMGGDEETEMLEGGFGNEEIGDPGLILKGDEAVAFGGGGALAADHQAGDVDGGSVGQLVEAGGREVMGIAGGAPPQRHRVRAGGGSLGGEVGVKAFGKIHGR